MLILLVKIHNYLVLLVNRKSRFKSELHVQSCFIKKQCESNHKQSIAEESSLDGGLPDWETEEVGDCFSLDLSFLSDLFGLVQDHSDSVFKSNSFERTEN
jgi:hypothetical protein